MRLLFIEDNADVVELIASDLRRNGFDFTYATVDSRDGLRRALDEQSWSAIISELNLPAFTVEQALEMVRSHDLDIPFIVVSGTIGEEKAVDLIRAGANDYVWKDRLERLGPALQRELRDVQLRVERRALFDALRRSEDRYRRVFEKAPLGIGITTRDGLFVSVNRRLAEIFGTTSEHVVGRRFDDFRHPDDPPPPLAGGRAQFESRSLRVDASVVWTSITLAPIASDAGELEQIVWLIEDITDRRRAKEELRSSREQLAAAQAIAHVGSYEYDFATGKRTWSDELFRIYGLEPQSEVDMSFVDTLLHPDDVDLVMSRRKRTIEMPDSFEGDHRIILPSGVRTLHGRGSVIRNERGWPVKIVAVLQDVTEARAQERELRLRALQQGAIAELSNVAQRSLDEETFALACELVATRLGIEHTLLLEWEGPELRHAAGVCADAPALIAAIAPEVSDELRQTCILDDVPALVALGVRRAAIVPIASARTMFGALAAFSHDAERLGESAMPFVESLANILAEALERERARIALVASEERYRAVVEVASEVIFTLSTDGTFTTLNAAFEPVTGFPVDEWLGRSWLDLVNPDDRPFATLEVEAAIMTGETVLTELTIDCPRGAIVLELSLLATERHGRTAVYGYARDITAARRAERERRELTRKLQLVLESTAEGIITTDLQGHCTMCNTAAAHMLGSTREAILGLDMHALLQTRQDSPILGVGETGEVLSSATDVFMRIDGFCFPVEYSAAPIVDQGRRVGVVVGFTDVTERHKLQAKLEQANRIASLGRLAATVAHEFNNVLMGISPFVELLRRKLNVDSSLDHIARAVKRGKRVTEDILRFTQPAEPTRIALEVQPWLQNVTLEARSLLTPLCNVETFVADPGLRIDGDPNQLQQIFTNLVLNSRDAMPEGGLLTIAVQRETPGTKFAFGVIEQPERFAHFIVRDTGFGMSQDVLRHIFEPLFTTKRSGTGLGVPVALQVVHRHGGEMFVESEVGVGTVFHIFLPLAEPALADIDVLPNDQRVTNAKRVLLVEDDPSVASGISRLLELEGVTVTVAPNGETALAALQSEVPDLVILDMGLPDTDGPRLYETIAGQHPSLPVIISTGHADRSKLEPLLRRPHVGFLLKPYDVASLLDLMREVSACD